MLFPRNVISLLQRNSYENSQKKKKSISELSEIPNDYINWGLVLISGGGCSKLPQTGYLKQQKFILT